MNIGRHICIIFISVFGLLVPTHGYLGFIANIILLVSLSISSLMVGYDAIKNN